MAERNSLPKRPHETITDSLLHDGLPRDCRNIILRDIGRDPGLPMPPDHATDPSLCRGTGCTR